MIKLNKEQTTMLSQSIAKELNNSYKDHNDKVYLLREKFYQKYYKKYPILRKYLEYGKNKFSVQGFLEETYKQEFEKIPETKHARTSDIYSEIVLSSIESKDLEDLKNRIISKFS